MATETTVRTSAESSLENDVQLMTKIGSCSGPSFSPDGRSIAFITNLTGSPQVWTVAREGGWPEQVTVLDDPVLSVRWSPAGEWLAMAVAPGGGMNVQIYLVRPDGTGLRLLTPGGTVNNWLGPWSDDGRSLAVSSSTADPGRMDCFLIDLETGAWRLIAENPGVGALSDLSRDGRHALVSRVINRSDNDIFLIDLQTGRETLLTPHMPPGAFGYATFAPDAHSVYLASDLDSDLARVVRIPISEGGPGDTEVIAERPNAEPDGLWLTPDARTALVFWNAAGRDELEVLDLATRTSRTVTLPGEVHYDADVSRDGRYLAVTLSSATQPADIWTLDLEPLEWRQITHSPHAGVDLVRLVTPELVQFAAHDGLALSGWLYRSRGSTRPGPLVLSFHGGPEGQERPIFNSTYQALLSQGIAVLAPNVRGSVGYGKRFVNLDNGPLRVDAVRDILSCVQYVVDVGIADPARIGIMGGSYGGYMTMAGLVEYPERFAAGANLFGIVNFETFFEHTEPWMAAISKVEYGDPETQRDMLREFSPIHRMDRVRAPTLVLHGANDTNVPVVEAEQVVRELEQRGVTVAYVLFPDEGHGFRKLPNRITATVAITRWFVEHLAG